MCGRLASLADRYHMARSSVLFFRKHVHGWRWFIIVPFRLGSAVRTTIRPMRCRKVVAAKAYWRGLLEGIQVDPQKKLLIGTHVGAY